MNKPICLVQAPIATRSGYGDHARDIVRSLIKMGKFDVMIWGTRWGETSYIDLNTPRDNEIFSRIMKEPTLPRQPELFIHVTVPNEFMTIGKYNIGITAGIETTHCSAPWIEGLNRMDLNIVPSRHALTVFQQTNYTRFDERTRQPIGQLKNEKPLEVLFEGVDTSVFKFDENVPPTIRHELKKIDESFCFLFVGHWLQGEIFQDRKDVGGLVKIFLETFKNVPNPPALILKTSMSTNSVMDRNEIEKRIAQIRHAVSSDKPLPNVYFIHGDLTQEEMNGLYNAPKVKAHVSFTKGEGFGRPILEATLSRKPMIAPNWSGHVDFLNKEFSILLPGELTKIHPSAVWKDVLIPESSWFTINYQVASNAMMEVWKNYQNHKQNALKQAMYSEQLFSFDKMHDNFVKIIDKYVPKFAMEVPVNIPKMGSIKLPKLKPVDAPAVTTVTDINKQLDARSSELPREKNEHETAVSEQPKEESTNEN